MQITGKTDFIPIVKAGPIIQAKNSNGIMIDNDNGGGVSVIINNAWVIPPGRSKSIGYADPRVKDDTDYNVRFDTANAYGFNTSATEQAVAVISFIYTDC